MTKTRGMLTLEQLKGMVAEGAIETVLAGFTDHYGRLMGKRFDAEMFVDEIAKHGGHACDYLLTVDMEMEPVPGYKFANWELGYGDVHMVPDMGTLRLATWLDKTAFVVCDVKSEKTHDFVDVAPRTILRRQIDAAKKAGYVGYAGTELEHYLFQTSYRQAAQQDFRNLEPAGWYLEDYHMLQGTRTESFHASARRHLKLSGVPVENSKGEWGKGQHELNVRYAEVLEMADRHVVFKQCLKEIAESMGMSVTFMAKFAADGAGSSCHIHFSLWRDGKNAFAGGPDAYNIPFLGGWIAHVPDVMVFYAPTVNSYKSYVDGSWAPTRLAWSNDNRTAGFRIVGSGTASASNAASRARIAIPILRSPRPSPPGSMASRTRSSRRRCSSATSTPAQEPAARAVYAERRDRPLREEARLPKELFGEDVVEHYTHFYRTEAQAYDRAVTDWERRRYFERI